MSNRFDDAINATSRSRLIAAGFVIPTGKHTDPMTNEVTIAISNGNAVRFSHRDLVEAPDADAFMRGKLAESDVLPISDDFWEALAAYDALVRGHVIDQLRDALGAVTHWDRFHPAPSPDGDFTMIAPIGDTPSLKMDEFATDPGPYERIGTTE